LSAKEKKEMTLIYVQNLNHTKLRKVQWTKGRWERVHGDGKSVTNKATIHIETMLGAAKEVGGRGLSISHELTRKRKAGLHLNDTITFARKTRKR
jgi:hypothetical protein